MNASRCEFNKIFANKYMQPLIYTKLWSILTQYHLLV